ncbi:MAG TPA: LysM peptidoglycan-binding domain-containing protein [Candidatus Limnocylindrales bacterium]|nr:LysM peptidoglycan-binding domain-containing protein [Candidatus Limnocylindrales bacterium]
MTTPDNEPSAPARAPEPVRAPISAGAEAAEAPVSIGEICPYLLASDGGWRSAAPNRDHRCTAVDPPAPLTAEKQRVLCLAPAHAGCAAFRAARAARASMLAPGLDPAIVASADAARRPVARSTAVVLEQPRFAVAGMGGNVAVSQAVLVALMILAFVVVLVSRLSAGSPAPVPSPTPAITAPPSPSPTPRPTPRPTPTPSPSGVAPSGSVPVPPSAAAVVPSPAAVPTTYRVEAGDTLVGIASAFGTTVGAIQEMNSLSGSALRIGQLLKIP